ncbi:hypothetical protein AHAS_Ahas12G0110700 [Arachis hypogaea]
MWAQIMSHYILSSTHESSITTDLALLIWCILTERPINISYLIRQAMGCVHTKGNLPFPALVTDLIAAAGVPQEGKDVKETISAKDNIVLSGKYLKPPAGTANLDIAIPFDIPTTSSAPQKSSHQLLVELTQKVDRYE